MADEIVANALEVEGGPVTADPEVLAVETPDATPEKVGEDEAPAPKKEGEEERDEEEKPKRKGGYLRKLERAEAELEHWRELALSNRQQATPAAAVVVPEQKPKQEDYKTWEEYETARDEWLLSQAEKRVAARTQTAQAETQWQKQEDQGRKEHDDWDDVVYAKTLQVSQAMAEVIRNSEVGADLAYYLGSNPDEAERLARLTPLQAAKELGKIEARLAKDQPAAKVPQVTKAPKPVIPVSKSAPVSDWLHDDSLSADEWAKRRTADLAKRGVRL